MKRTTVKEIKKWFKTLEENRYKRTYNSDARRVAWMVNNEGVDLSEMPETMRKKWVKAEYKKERYMANKFLEGMKQNESVRLDEAEIWFNPKEFEPFLKKIGLDFPKYPKQGDVLYKGKTVGYMSNFNGFMVYSKSLLKQLQKVERKYKLGIWNPTSGLTMENKIRQTIRETIRDLMGRKLTESIDSQVKGFFKHTLLPAFSEDFTFGDKKNADRALKLLKKLVSQLKVNDFYISEGKLTEGKIVRWEIPMKDKKKVEMIVKKLRLKDTKDYSIYGSGKTFEMELDSKYEDKVLELLMKMNIKVRG